ncbi:hypothetical protein C1J01_41445 [Nonomuraea aridisoli]|uniref:Uncharacterized protein n=2 Tax=Nonomuraea aridisoli TaxID=2070368 RepID=A0A2W2E4X7_9ACTN|nr:hypothetical protein C1J01_41445 [Nonomuraea aridisoli]
MRDMGGSFRSIACQIHCSRSALNRLASGQVQNPDRKTIHKLRRLAEHKNPAGTITEEELQRLLQRVFDEDTHTATEPAADTVAQANGRAPAAPAAWTGAPFVAPVQGADGDRRNGLRAEPLWPVDELVVHLDSGRYEHAVGMLDYAGGKAPAKESAAAIQACRGRGLTEATDTLLRKVGGRPEEIVFTVIRHLIDAGNAADARALAQIRSSVRMHE